LEDARVIVGLDTANIDTRGVKLVFQDADKTVPQNVPQEDRDKDHGGADGGDADAFADQDAPKQEEPEKSVEKTDHGRDDLVHHDVSKKN